MQLLGFLKSIFTDKVNQSSSFEEQEKPLKETWVVRDIPSEPGSTLNAYKESDLEGMEEKQKAVSDAFDRAKAYQQQQGTPQKEKQKTVSEQYELAQKIRRQQREQEKPLNTERPTQEYKNTPFQ